MKTQIKDLPHTLFKSHISPCICHSQKTNRELRRTYLNIVSTKIGLHQAKTQREADDNKAFLSDYTKTPKPST